MEAVELRPRSSTELLDAAIEFIRGHYGVLVTAVAVGQLPALVFNLVHPPSVARPFDVWREHTAFAVTRLVVQLLAYGAFQLFFVRVVDDLVRGRPAVLGRALERTLPRAGAALLAVIVKYVVMVLWSVLFVFPMIWAAARYFAVATAMEVEGLAPFAAIARSKELARGNNLRIIGVAGIPYVLGVVALIFAQQVALALHASPTTLVVTSALAMVVLFPFMAVPGIFLYYDIRTRREGLDLDPATLSTPDPSPSAAA